MDESLRTAWPFYQTFQVWYHDIDALNHLNHAAYFVYMETLRCGYYLRLTGSTDPTRLDIIIAEANCRYVAPAMYDTQILGETAPALPIGNTSFTLLYRFLTPDRAKTYARGRTVVVCYDYSKGQKQAIPTDRRERLERDGVDPKSEGWV